MTDRPRIPIARLIESDYDDGSDYGDGLCGWASGTYNPDTRTLTIAFERDDEDAFDEDDDWSSATYTFRLTEDTP